MRRVFSAARVEKDIILFSTGQQKFCDEGHVAGKGKVEPVL